MFADLDDPSGMGVYVASYALRTEVVFRKELI